MYHKESQTTVVLSCIVIQAPFSAVEVFPSSINIELDHCHTHKPAEKKTLIGTAWDVLFLYAVTECILIPVCLGSATEVLLKHCLYSFSSFAFDS